MTAKGFLTGLRGFLAPFRISAADQVPTVRAAAQRGRGKAYDARWASGSVKPQFHHVSRQVKRREQRKAMKRAMKAGV